MSDMTQDSRSDANPVTKIVIVAVPVILIIGLAMAWISSPNVAKTTPGNSEVVTQTPTGAGTNPDGVADERVEGLMNQTATDDFVDSSAASDITPVEAPETEGEPATSAANVSPVTGEGTVDQMLPQTDG